MSVKIVTDSTSDLPAEVAQELGIAVVPLYVHFGTEVYKDGVEISPDQFYQRLVQAPSPPTTSAPSPGVFQEVYRNLSAETDEILSLHISGKLSATCQSALLGKEQLGGKGRVEVIDSLTLTMALGLLAIVAARAARAGANLDEVANLVRRTMPRAHVFGLLDTLEYLHKGGRIGKAQAFLGTLLSVKPILAIREGEAYPIERVRTRPKALERLYELVKERQPLEEMAILGSTPSDEVERLAQRLKLLFPGKEPYRARFGPVLGTHLGPGSLGVAFIEAGNRGSAKL